MKKTTRKEDTCTCGPNFQKPDNGICLACGHEIEALYWSERGEVACKTHAPYRGSDTWVWERWRKMKDSELAECASADPRMAECHTCRAIAERANSHARGD